MTITYYGDILVYCMVKGLTYCGQLHTNMHVIIKLGAVHTVFILMHYHVVCGDILYYYLVPPFLG